MARQTRGYSGPPIILTTSAFFVSDLHLAGKVFCTLTNVERLDPQIHCCQPSLLSAKHLEVYERDDVQANYHYDTSGPTLVRRGRF